MLTKILKFTRGLENFIEHFEISIYQKNVNKWAWWLLNKKKVIKATMSWRKERRRRRRRRGSGRVI